MSWDKSKRVYWDVGDTPPYISLTQKKLASLMLALIRCDGKVHDIHCGEKLWGTSDLKYKPQFCSACLRVSLPVGTDAEFERISGLGLTEPPKVTA